MALSIKFDTQRKGSWGPNFDNFIVKSAKNVIPSSCYRHTIGY